MSARSSGSWSGSSRPASTRLRLSRLATIRSRRSDSATTRSSRSERAPSSVTSPSRSSADAARIVASGLRRSCDTERSSTARCSSRSRSAAPIELAITLMTMATTTNQTSVIVSSVNPMRTTPFGARNDSEYTNPLNSATGTDACHPPTTAVRVIGTSRSSSGTARVMSGSTRISTSSISATMPTPARATTTGRSRRRPTREVNAGSITPFWRRRLCGSACQSSGEARAAGRGRRPSCRRRHAIPHRPPT